MDSASKGSRKTLEAFRNRHAGQRGFILGNGPSLKQLDLSLLADEITFGVNGIFYLFEEMGFKPTYYVVEDKLFAEDRIEDVDKLSGTQRIFGDYLKYCFADRDDVIWANVRFDYREYPGFPHFSRDAAEHLWVGGTVTYLCMQLAYFMGLREIYLIGFDHSYTIPKDAVLDGTEITSTSDDPNHFHPDYFGKGRRWHQPRLDRMERGYRRALQAFQSDGRSIYNATAGGKLEIFPRMPYGSLFKAETPKPPLQTRPMSFERTALPGADVRISAVVCTYRNPEFLERTLRSLTEQTLDPQSYEIIVVDNNSGDSTPDVVARFPSVRYVFEPEQGLSAARNAGIRVARSDIIAYIDDDAEAGTSWLAALLDVYTHFPNAQAVGGKVLPIWGAEQPSWLTPEKHRTLSLIDWGGEVRPLCWPERVIGVNCSFRRSVFDQHGLFDTWLGRTGASLLGSEDVELQERIHRAEGSVYYTPDAVVHHYVPAFRMTRLYFRVRWLAKRVDQAILEMRAQGIEHRILHVLEPIRAQAAAGSDFRAQGEAVSKALRRALIVLRGTPGWAEFEKRMMGSAEERQSLKVHASDAVARGALAEAEEALRALAYRMLVSADAFVPLADVLMLSGHLEEALEEIDLARLLEPDHPGLLRLRASCLHQMGDLEGAREALRDRIRLNPGDLEARLGLGKAELDMGLNEEALRTYDGAVAADCERVEAWIGLARTCIKLGDGAGCEHAIERVRALAPDHAELPDLLEMRPAGFRPQLLTSPTAPAPTARPAAMGRRRLHAAPLEGIETSSSADDRVRISAIVCTYRNPELLERTLQSLLAQTLDRDAYEVIVVDNNSNDSTPEVVSRFPSVKYVAETTQGLAYARNAGIQAAQAPVLAFIDDDAEAEPGWLFALLEVYESVPSAFAVGGKAVPIWDELPPSWLDENYYRALSLIDWGTKARPLTWPERIIGVNCSFRREVFTQIGGFDIALGRMGDYLIGSEDTEIQQRIHDDGCDVYYTPHAVVRHHVPAHRMTRAYMLERNLGNLFSVGITLLREEGRDREVAEILSVLQNETYPVLVIPGLSEKIAIMGVAFRHVVMALQGASRWDEFQTEHMADPDEMQRLLGRVGEALARNDWADAEGTLRALVHRSPMTPVAYFPLIDVLMIAERFDEAREVIEFGVAVNPANAPLLTYLGENRRCQGDYAGAADALERSFTRSPKDPRTLVALGKLALETRHCEKALAYYQQATELVADDIDCWVEIVRGLRQLGERELCERSLARIRELDPERAELAELAGEPTASQPQLEILARSNERLGRFHDRHRGQRCVIIGNGPSLNQMDLSFLRNEITFGLNRSYLLSERMDFRPDYYVCMNPLVLEQSEREIRAIQAPKFLSAQGMQLFSELEDTVFLRPMPGPDFVEDLARGVWEGYTVTYVALQLAYYMGFSEVVLIGVDHEYQHPPGLPNQEVVSIGDDPNHFHPQYFGPGVRWHLPDLENAESAYRLAHERFQSAGRSVIDATVEGKLQVFPKRDYREVFKLDSAATDPEASSQPAALATHASARYKVTAIVSTYNAERLLGPCLEDLQRQTIANATEIIVIDSGSPQNEERIVRELQRGQPNVVYVRTARETLYQAWNRGVSMARGEYLTNANTDDRHRPDALECLVRELDRGEVGLVYADSLITRGENETFERNTADRVWKLPPFSQRQVLMDCPFGPQPMWRRTLHDETGLFEGKYRLAGDYEFFMRLAMQHEAHHLDETLGLYHESPDNLSYNPAAMSSELDDFLGRYRSTTPIEQIYPFLQIRASEEARTAAWLDYANHLVWMTPYPAFDYAEEIYRKLMARGDQGLEVSHNLALLLLLRQRSDEGAPLLRRLAHRSRIAEGNLRLLEAGHDVDPRELKVMSIAHPSLQTLPVVIPAWETKLPIGS